MTTLPPEIFGHWIHSHEEDTDDVNVYRPASHQFPRARGRTGFEIRESGEFIQHDIGPADGVVKIAGRWTAEGADRIHVSFEGERKNPFTLVIFSLERNLLKLRKIEASGP